MSSSSYNVADYTLSELMSILQLQDPDPSEIRDRTNFYITKYKQSNPPLSVFFLNVQSELLQYAQSLYNDGEEEDGEQEGEVAGGGGDEDAAATSASADTTATYPSGDKQISDWYQNEVLTQSNPTQTDKITDRKQTTQLFGNEHVPMNREQIATTDTYQVPVKQDTLNPNLKNTIRRFVNLDSQFRQYTGGPESMSTNYTCDLSDTLKNVLNLSLYSYQIPYSWYTIDAAYGNTCFWITDVVSSTTVAVSVPQGNYTPTAFATQLATSLNDAGVVSPSASPLLSYSSASGILTLQLAGAVCTTDASFSFTIVPGVTLLTFFDFDAILTCGDTCMSKSNRFMNNTLGWLMGFRMPYVVVEASGNVAPAVVDMNGPKYLILVVDDYNQSHVNNAMVSITQFAPTLRMPMYYSPDLPYTCINPVQNLASLVNNSSPQNGLLVASKYEHDYTATQIVLPSAPRTLTNAQLYTLNAINANNNNLTQYLSKAPTSSDILAVLPIKVSGASTGTILMEYSGSLQNSERTYFGPVNIDRMAVKLLDDKGNVVNLHGNDWCFTLQAECLYQY